MPRGRTRDHGDPAIGDGEAGRGAQHPLQQPPQAPPGAGRAFERTTPLHRSTSRPVTAPASPVFRSPRTSILSDLLKPSVQGIIFTFA